MLKNDLFLVSSDGFSPFASESEEDLDRNEFEIELKEICHDAGDVVMPEIPDKCSDTTHFNAMIL